MTGLAVMAACLAHRPGSSRALPGGITASDPLESDPCHSRRGMLMGLPQRSGSCRAGLKLPTGED